MMFINTTSMYADALFIINIAAFTYIPHNVLQGYKDSKYHNQVSNFTQHNQYNMSVMFKRYLYPLNFKLNVAMFNSAIKLRVPINIVDCSNMMCYQ